MHEGYIIITPAKDEEENLPNLISSIIKQSIQPLLWLIVDDSSVDSTSVLIREAMNKFQFIKSIRLGPHPRDLGSHYAYVCREGFEFAIEYCSKNTILFEYIALIDADMMLEENYFEKILLQFNQNPLYGIISGSVYLRKNGKLLLENENTIQKIPRGGCRMWRKRCFEEVGGYQITICPDSVSNIKAILRGWTILQLEDAMAIQCRPTSSAEGLLKGFVNNGKFAYCLNKHPFLVFLNFLSFCFKTPYYIGIPYLYGYLLAAFKSNEKINDEEIKIYFWNTRLKEIYSILLMKISFKKRLYSDLIYTRLKNLVTLKRLL